MNKSITEIREEIRIMNEKNLIFASKCKIGFTILSVFLIILTLSLAIF
ncbi:hypothetical protein [Clostridium chrysemydis]|nr:hypothetical protein [Clostridium chrysemydis]